MLFFTKFGSEVWTVDKDRWFGIYEVHWLLTKGCKNLYWLQSLNNLKIDLHLFANTACTEEYNVFSRLAFLGNCFKYISKAIQIILTIYCYMYINYLFLVFLTLCSSQIHFKQSSNFFIFLSLKKCTRKKQANPIIFRSYISINFYNQNFFFILSFVIYHKLLQEKSDGDLIKILESDGCFSSLANIS